MTMVISRLDESSGFKDKSISYKFTTFSTNLYEFKISKKKRSICLIFLSVASSFSQTSMNLRDEINQFEIIGSKNTFQWMTTVRLAIDVWATHWTGLNISRRRSVTVSSISLNISGGGAGLRQGDPSVMGVGQAGAMGVSVWWWASGVSYEDLSPSRTYRHDWKHYLPTTLFPDGKNLRSWQNGDRWSSFFRIDRSTATVFYFKMFYLEIF